MMRILWATPFNVKSAIARYSRLVTDEIAARGHTVELLRLEDKATSTLDILDSELTVHAADTLKPARLRGYDVCVVNFGDYLSFHAGALALASSVPAVAVLHDANMENFLLEAFQAYPGLAALLEAWPPASLALPEGRTPGQRAISFLAAISSGCVVHGPHYVEDVVAACPGPTVQLPLCYPEIGAVSPEPEVSDAFVVMCFGMINRNKQPERILRALAIHPALRARGRVRFVGPIEDGYRKNLAAHAARLGLAEPDFTGWVDDAQLCRLLAQAHLLCCLRHPIAEGGSASLITALYSGRPVVVDDAGSYAAIPDGLVYKISADEDPAPLATVMADVAGSPLAAEAAARAAAFARRHYAADTYVDGLIPLLEAALANRPELEAARGMGRRLHSLGLTFADGTAAGLENRLACVRRSPAPLTQT